MQHIQISTVKPILHGSVAALVTFAIAFGEVGIASGVKKVRLKASTTDPLLLEMWAEVTTAFDGTTPALNVGSTELYTDFISYHLIGLCASTSIASSWTYWMWEN